MHRKKKSTQAGICIFVVIIQLTWECDTYQFRSNNATILELVTLRCCPTVVLPTASALLPPNYRSHMNFLSSSSLLGNGRRRHVNWHSGSFFRPLRERPPLHSRSTEENATRNGVRSFLDTWKCEEQREKRGTKRPNALAAYEVLHTVKSFY